MDELKLILIGMTVSTFGIKGELKVISDFEKKEKAFKVNQSILINNIEHVITNIRYHKNYILMEIDNKKNINDILEYVGFNIYVKRSDLKLEDNEYLYVDLIGSSVIDNDKSNLGKVVDVEFGPRYDYLKVEDKGYFLIPLIPEYFIKFDKEKKLVYTNMAKDLKV